MGKYSKIIFLFVILNISCKSDSGIKAADKNDTNKIIYEELSTDTGSRYYIRSYHHNIGVPIDFDFSEPSPSIKAGKIEKSPSEIFLSKTQFPQTGNEYINLRYNNDSLIFSSDFEKLTINRRIKITAGNRTYILFKFIKYGANFMPCEKVSIYVFDITDKDAITSVGFIEGDCPYNKLPVLNFENNSLKISCRYMIPDSDQTGCFEISQDENREWFVL